MKKNYLTCGNGIASHHIKQASLLTSQYAKEGLMLEISQDRIRVLLEQERFLVTIDVVLDKVVACAGLTFEYLDGKLEFGAWAVDFDLQKTGLGLDVYRQVLSLPASSQGDVIAFGNEVSSKIFRKLGCKEISHSKIHSSAFEPCKTCSCDKGSLSEGVLCVDSVFLLV